MREERGERYGGRKEEKVWGSEVDRREAGWEGGSERGGWRNGVTDGGRERETEGRRDGGR